jgi:hypothetical protein
VESSSPRWSPDGGWLWFQSSRPGGEPATTAWRLRADAPGGEAEPVAGPLPHLVVARRPGAGVGRHHARPGRARLGARDGGLVRHRAGHGATPVRGRHPPARPGALRRAARGRAAVQEQRARLRAQPPRGAGAGTRGGSTCRWATRRRAP